MSFFHSLRRRSMTTTQNQDAAPLKTTPSTKRRALTVWSSASKQHKPVEWEIQVLKSECDSEPKADAFEEEVYPKFNPDDPGHKSLMSFNAQRPPKQSSTESKSRGRSLSLTKTSSFSNLRKYSKSRSRSGSPTRNIFHKAAELIKAPTAFFYKDRTSEDSTKALVEPTSPTKSLRSKKSVRFMSSDAEDEGVQKSSPIPIPGASAPSLPPVDVSTSGLMTLGIEHVSTLTARPPPTPVIEAEIANAATMAMTQATIELPAVSIAAAKEDLLSSQQERSGDANPFSDSAEARVSIDKFSITDPAEAANCAEHSGKFISQFETELTNTEDTQDESKKDRKEAAFSFSSSQESIEPVTDVSDIPTRATVKLSLIPEEGLHMAQDANSTTESIGNAINHSLPLRLKRSNNSLCMHNQDSVTHQDISPFADPTTEGNINARERNDETNDIVQELHLQTQVRDGKTRKHINAGERSVEEELNSCTTKLRSLSIEEKPAERTIIEEKSPRVPSKPTLKINVSPDRPSRGSESPSPTRRRFRFENRADTSSAEQFTGSPCTPDAPKDHQDNQTSETLRRPNKDLQTPSPSDIPLPPSVHPSRHNTVLCQAHTFRDQHGWSPFAEDRFAETALDMILKDKGDKKFIKMICKNGGFRHFWKDHDLPKNTIPQNDSIAPTQEEGEYLVDAIIGWAHHRYPKEPVKVSPRPKFTNVFPVKYFKRRDGSPTKVGFFAPITSFGCNGSSESIDDETHNIEHLSSERTATPSDISFQDSLTHMTNEQAYTSFYCGSCDHEPCLCKHEKKISVCICNPCKCNPCLCNVLSSGEPTNERSAKEILAKPVREILGQTCADSSRVLSASAKSEPGQNTPRKLPPIGSVPLRYFNEAAAGSSTTMASDTTLDEEEVYYTSVV